MEVFTKYDNKIIKLFEGKKQEMVDFLNQYLSPSERTRIGEDIVRIMPNVGDLATIKMLEIDENKKRNERFNS